MQGTATVQSVRTMIVETVMLMADSLRNGHELQHSARPVHESAGHNHVKGRHQQNSKLDWDTIHTENVSTTVARPMAVLTRNYNSRQAAGRGADVRHGRHCT